MIQRTARKHPQQISRKITLHHRNQNPCLARSLFMTMMVSEAKVASSQEARFLTTRDCLSRCSL